MERSCHRSDIGRLTIAGLLILILALASNPATAQPPEEDLPGTTVGSDFYNNTYFAIGTHLSLLSGAGLSGRVTFPNRMAVQLTSFVVAVGGITHFNVGGEGQYAFMQGDGGRLFGLVGAGYYLSTSDEPTKPGNRIKSPVHIGGGIGYEWFLSRHSSLDLALPFTWFVEEGKVFPIPSVSFHYYFK